MSMSPWAVVSKVVEAEGPAPLLDLGEFHPQRDEQDGKGKDQQFEKLLHFGASVSVLIIG